LQAKLYVIITCNTNVFGAIF